MHGSRLKGLPYGRLGDGALIMLHQTLFSEIVSLSEAVARPPRLERLSAEMNIYP